MGAVYVGDKAFANRARLSVRSTRGRVEWRTSDCPAVTVPLGDVLQSGPDVYVVPRILVGRV